MGQKRVNRPATAGDVTAAVNAALAANDATLVDATYVDEQGNAIGSVVGASSIPRDAFGVVVDAQTSWRPFLLGVLGITSWDAGATATAKTPGRSLGGGVMPVGIKDVHFNGLDKCEITDFADCVGQHLTSGHLNAPGQFGWLKFGLNGNGGACQWASSLGMLDDGGCRPEKPFLQSQIGPEPPANSHGCCTAVGQPGASTSSGALRATRFPQTSTSISNIVSLSGSRFGTRHTAMEMGLTTTSWALPPWSLPMSPVPRICTVSHSLVRVRREPRSSPMSTAPLLEVLSSWMPPARSTSSTDRYARTIAEHGSPVALGERRPITIRHGSRLALDHPPTTRSSSFRGTID